MSVVKTIKSKQSHFKSTSPTQSDMQSWEEQSQGAIYTVEYACRYGNTRTSTCVFGECPHLDC